MRGKPGTLKRLWGEVARYRWRIIAALAAGGVFTLSTLSMPFFFKYLVDQVLKNDQLGTDAKVRLLWTVLLLVFVILLVRAASVYVKAYYSSYVSYHMSYDLRNRIYGHIHQLSFSFFDKSRAGELMSRVTGDVAYLQQFALNSLEDFFVAPLTVVVGAILLFVKYPEVALSVTGSLVFIAVVLRIFGRMLAGVSRRMQEINATLTAILSEGISTIRIVQAFGMEKREIDKFRETNELFFRKSRNLTVLSAALMPIVEFAVFLSVLLVIGMIGYKIISGTSTFGDILAIAGTMAIVANPVNRVTRVFVNLNQGAAAAERIFSVLDTPIEIKDASGALPLPETSGRIEFKNVDFSYNSGEEILKDFNLEVRPGQVIAIVGSSGSGKSTVMNLIPRFYEPDAGSVEVDGVNIAAVKLADLRRHIGIVAQDSILVHGTIRENIAYGKPDAEEIDIIRAAQSANAHNFIMELPEGYNTLVGERGVTLSGGERQRIAIARALLKDPRILLLDEATSSLDTVSEAVVQDALNKLMFGRTTLIAAHRLSTVRNADLIVVLKDGRIVERGTHDDLMHIRGEYWRLQMMQGVQR
jgi:subfamily B ATP-binding cassette protein MsbA